MQSSRSNDVFLSKQLSWLLRHGAEQMGLPLQADGFIAVNAILQHPRYAKHYTLAILQRLVAADKKQRYTLRCNGESGEFEIRANQGHSLTAVKAEECLQRIENSTEVPLAVHGTYYKHWPSIRQHGLRRLQRNHVHFATTDKIGSGVVVSGFRSDCQILIYLNVHKMLTESTMPLYRSANNVILCGGLEESGCIPTEFFAKVVDRRTGADLPY